MTEACDFEAFEAYLRRVPAIVGAIGKGVSEDGQWWVKFAIDIDHAKAWNVVQEFAHVLNYLSLEERLSTVFIPVSPPPSMNGGPRTFLSWVVECKDSKLDPSTVAKWLEGRLPRPVDDLSQWTDLDDPQPNV